MIDRLARHDLVWIDRSWSRRIAGESEVLLRWIERDRPAVARRRSTAEPMGGVALAVATPGKGRLAFQTPAQAILRMRPPLLLASALESAPRRWRDQLRQLDAKLCATGTEARVFGSLAWQRLTNDPYLTADSDVDLLIAPPNFAALIRVLEILRDSNGAASIDGEIVNPRGEAVAWRELLNARSRVLVKSINGVALRGVDEFLDLFSAEAA